MSSPNDKIKVLFQWCCSETKKYPSIEIKNFTTSWRNGLGFCAILENYAPHLIHFDDLKPDNIYENNDLAFNVAEKEFGISSLLDPHDMVQLKVPDRLSMITYLFQYYSAFISRSIKIKDKDLGEIRKPLIAIENKLLDDQTKDESVIEDDKSDSTQVCSICQQPVFMLEKMVTSDKVYHRACYRSNQLVNLYERNRTLERTQMNNNDNCDLDHISINASSVESLNSTNSATTNKRRQAPPLPVKPKITITKNKISTNPIALRLPSPKPRSKFSKAQSTYVNNDEGDGDEVIYPKDLNPFAESELDKGSLKSQDNNESNPFSKYLDDSPILPGKKVHSKTKRKAPPAPKMTSLPPLSSPSPAKEAEKPNMTDNTTDMTYTQDDKIMNGDSKKFVDVETAPESSASIELQSDDKHSENLEQTSEERDISIEQDSFDTSIEKMEEKNWKKSQKSIEKSHNKAPAPPRPAPPKREIRGDKHEFIPFETIYSELEEVNVKQSEIEMRGRSLQNALWEAKEEDESFEDMLQDWLDLVKEKNELFLQEKRLHEILKRQELEERQADLEHELRLLMSKQETLKSAAEKAREEELLNQILETVNKRSELVECESDTAPSLPDIPKKKKSQSTLKKFFSMSRKSSNVNKTLLSTRSSSRSLTKTKSREKKANNTHSFSSTRN